MRDYDERDFPVEHIVEPERASRLVIDPEALGRLADDIAANGLHQRIGLRTIAGDRRAELIFGHRRLLAYRLLHRAAIPARIYPPTTDVLHVRMAENEMREQLNPIEQAMECRAFVDRGEPIAHVARRFRRSAAWVAERLELLELPADVQRALAEGALALGVARALGAVDFDTYRAQLVAEAIRNGASERAVAVWVSAYHADAARIKANTITVDEIVARREEFKVVARCPGCEKDHPFEVTVSLRFCRPCATQLAALLTADPATPA
ncbi:MAG: ParB/RepB/Spo0J family partition protein [Candidatus Rokuibacteriota bacterium]